MKRIPLKDLYIRTKLPKIKHHETYEQYLIRREHWPPDEPPIPVPQVLPYGKYRANETPKFVEYYVPEAR